jgi:cytochrome c2
MTHTAIVASALVIFATAAPAAATPQLLTQAKKAGLPAKNCQYCHTVATPKKETFKPDDLNDRGKWLVSEKDKQKAAEIKASWLKTYPAKK